MEPSSPVPYEVVFGTGRAEIGSAVAKALREAGIPFQTGIQATPSPRMIFTVPASRLLEAQDVVAFCLASGAGRPVADEDLPRDSAAQRGLPSIAGPESEPTSLRSSGLGQGGVPAGRPSSAATLVDDDDDDDDDDEIEDPAEQDWIRVAASPPWKTIGACALLVFAHLSFVLSFGGRRPPISRLMDLGALVDGQTLREPWRLLTSLFLHVDPPHVLWNGLSMTVFAVPLVATLGRWTTIWVYLLSGISGALMATAVNPEGTVTVGSSGAVAGLFGCWLVGALRRVWNSPRPTRARLRVMGIGLLVLPTLLSSTKPDGGRISVASHVGGALAGMVLGVLFSRRTLADPSEGSKPQSVEGDDRRAKAWPH